MKKLFILLVLALCAQVAVAQTTISTDSAKTFIGYVECYGKFYNPNIPSPTNVGFERLLAGVTTFTAASYNQSDSSVIGVVCVPFGTTCQVRTRIYGVGYNYTGNWITVTPLVVPAPGQSMEMVLSPAGGVNPVSICSNNLSNQIVAQIRVYVPDTSMLNTLRFAVSGNVFQNVIPNGITLLRGGTVVSSGYFLSGSDLYVDVDPQYQTVTGTTNYQLQLSLANANNVSGNLWGHSYYWGLVGANQQVTQWNSCNGDTVNVAIVPCGPTPTASFTYAAPVGGTYYTGDSVSFNLTANGYVDTTETILNGNFTGATWEKYPCPGTYSESVYLTRPVTGQIDTFSVTIQVLDRYRFGTPATNLGGAIIPVITSAPPVGIITVTVPGTITVLDPNDFMFSGGVWVAQCTIIGLSPGVSYSATMDYVSDGIHIGTCANPLNTVNFSTTDCANLPQPQIWVTVDTLVQPATYYVFATGLTGWQGAYLTWNLQIYRDNVLGGSYTGTPVQVTPGDTLGIFSGTYVLGQETIFLPNGGIITPCNVTLWSHPVTQNFVSVNQVAASVGIKVFPNPAMFLVLVETTEVPALIKIVDLVGRVVNSSIPTENKTELDISSLQSGVYIVHIAMQNGQTLMKQLVVAKP